MQYVNGMDIVKSVYDEVKYLINYTTMPWTDLGEYEECSVQSIENPTEEGLIFKCIGEIDTSPEIPLNVLYNANLQQIWDELCIESKKIEQLDSCNSVDYYSFGSPLGGAPRDFVFLRNFSVDYENKSAWVVIRSIHHESIPSPTYMKPSGWEFLQIAPNKTRITLVVQINDLTIAPYLRINSVDLKRIYRNTGIQITHTLPNLIKYIKKNYKKEIENHFKKFNTPDLFNPNLHNNNINNNQQQQQQKHQQRPYILQSSNSNNGNNINNYINNITTSNVTNNDNSNNNEKDDKNILSPQLSEEFEFLDVDEELYDVYKTPTYMFKETSKTVGELEVNTVETGWNCFRKFNDYTFYYRDYDENSLDFACSGSSFIDASPEVIFSYIFSEYSCKIDQWTCGMKTLKKIDDVTSLERMSFRSVLAPKDVLSAVLVKQVNYFQKGIIFIGYRSLLKPSTISKTGFWYSPSAYYIIPQERGCIIRYILKFRMYLPTSLYKVYPKKQILYVISEKTRATVEMIKYYSINPFYLQKRKQQVFPHWEGIDKFSELAEIFSNIQIQPSKPSLVINSPPNSNNHENEKKRKFRDNGINSTSISIPSTQFCFSSGGGSGTLSLSSSSSSFSPPQQISSPTSSSSSFSSSSSYSIDSSLIDNQQLDNNNNNNNNNNNQQLDNYNHSQQFDNNNNNNNQQLEYNNQQLDNNNNNNNSNIKNNDQEYLRFSEDWESYLTRKPFLLLISSGLHLRKPPKKKSPRSLENHNLKTCSLFDFLPYEMIQYIFSLMDAIHLIRMSRTCKYFNTICLDDNIWRDLYNREFTKNNSDSLFKWSSIEDINLGTEKRQLLDLTFDHKKSIKSSSPLSSSAPPIPQIPDILVPQNNLDHRQKNEHYWLNMFREKETINRHWRTGNGKVSSLRGHKGKISCLQMAPNQIFTGSKDKEFKSWNIATKQCESTTRCGASSVISFEKDNFTKLSTDIFPYCLYTHGIVRLGCSNGAIQHYNIATKEIEKEQRFLYVSNGFIFIKRDIYSYENNTVKLYDNETEQELQMIEIENTKINHCKIGKFENFCMIACTDKTVKLWDIDSNKTELVLNGHKGSVNCLDFLNDYQLITGSSDKSIRMWDIRNPSSAIHNIKSHSSKVKAISIYNNLRMCSGDEDSICLWHLEGSNKPNLLTTINNLSPVECLSIDDETMLAGFSDGEVSYYDFNSK
ncbi:hypothetical protein ACTFIV_004363 [Dictyostelium citrinum]